MKYIKLLDCGALVFSLTGTKWTKICSPKLLKLFYTHSLSNPLENVQTTLVPAGGATVVEFQVDYPGNYVLVDHALTRIDRGAWGILNVTGAKDDTLYSGHTSTTKAHSNKH
jgi:hypothetical protein